MSDWLIVDGASTFDMASDLNFKVQQAPGTGMPPISTIRSEYGLLDGALFQRQRTDTRSFSLIGTLKGDSISDLHTRRRALIDRIKSDRSASHQPVIVQYLGSGSTLQASGFYAGGLEFGDVEYNIEAKIGLAFEMLDPYWEATSATSATLTPQENLATDYIVQFDPDTGWTGIEGLSGGFGDSVLVARQTTTGTLYAGGYFTSVSGSSVVGIAQYINGAWEQLGDNAEITATEFIQALALDSNNDLLIGGNMDDIHTDACTLVCNNIVKYDNSASTFIDFDGGLSGDSDQVADFALDDDGNIYVGGLFDQAGSAASVAASNIAKWNIADEQWEDIGGAQKETGNVVVGALAYLNNKLYLGGEFTKVNVSGASISACHVATYDLTTGSWNPMGVGFDERVLDFAVGKDGSIYAAGSMSQLSDGSASIGKIAKWNQQNWESLSACTDGFLTFVSNDSEDVLYIGGRNLTTVGGLTLPDAVAQYNRGTWFYLDGIELPGADSRAVWIDINDNDVVTIAHNNSGNATVSASTNVTNGGTATAFPILTVSGSGRLYHIKNLTTRQAIYFDISLQAGETVTLDLTPGQKTFTSTQRGNILSRILPNSNISTFKLLPGDNTVTMFHADSSASATLEYVSRYWSLDGNA